MALKYRYIPPILFVAGTMISIWYLICNLQPVKPALYTFALCLAFAVYITTKLFMSSRLLTVKSYVLSISRRKYFVLILLSTITLIGILARVFFYFRFAYIPTSDPMTFYDSAKTLAEEGNLLGNSYVAFQPYLSAYNNILGNAMRFINDPWMATIVLNTFFDIMSAAVLYIFLNKLLKRGSHIPKVAFGIWILSPLNIIFSVISLPIIIVNFFVITSILISYLLILQIIRLKALTSILLSIILGLVLGLGNCFRPIFSIMLVGLTLVFLFMYLTTNRSFKFFRLFTGCLVLSLFIFLAIQRLNVGFVSNQTGLPAAKNPSGWSMYVGSTWDTSGEWRPYHNDNMRQICGESLAQNNFNQCHDELRGRAITNYKGYGIFMSGSLFIRKLYHQAEEQNYFYNAEHSIVDYTTSKTYKLINVYSVIYFLALFSLSGLSFYRLAKISLSKQLAHPILVFMVVTMIGWFLAFMLVESAPRYSTILYPIFIIFSALALNKKYADLNEIKY